MTLPTKLLRIFVALTFSAFSVPVPVFAAPPPTQTYVVITPNTTPTGSSVVSGNVGIAQVGAVTNINVNSTGLSKID